MRSIPQRCAVLAALAIAVSGCTGSLARTIVEPGAGGGFLEHGLGFPAGQLAELRSVLTGDLRADTMKVRAADGTPLHAFVVHPGYYGLAWEASREDGDFRFRFSWESDSVSLRSPPDPRGTVVALHGFYSESLQLLTQALHFAENGYRVILPDLRAHGQSEGRYVTFGAREREDLAALVEDLERRELLARPLVLYGASLGGSITLQAAADRVDADRVVTLAVPADTREVILEVGRDALPGWLRPLVDDARMRKALERAEEIAGFAFSEVSAGAFGPRVGTPVLLVHGREDELVPYTHAERLHEKLPCSTLRPVDRRGHATLMMDPTATAELVSTWLAEERSCNRGG